MPRQIALFIFAFIIVWLFYRDRKLRPMTSFGLWIPLFWVNIVGSRPVSLWFNAGGLQVENLDDYLEGSPFNRNIFIILILAGILILLKRRINWVALIKSNYYFILFFIFCGLSCLWSDYPFTSLKRYIKDFGNLVMAFIIITEANPQKAFRAVLSRYTYFVITLSVLFIKYFPELGRYYNRWTYDVVYCGITTNKNRLGQVAFICGIFLIWDFITTRAKGNVVPDKLDLFLRGILIVMVIWLLYMAHSATSILCMILGTFILFFLHSSFGKKQFRNLGTWSLCLLFFSAILYSVPGLFESLVQIFGRDAALTGRTDIWLKLLAQPLNPLLGAGYQSFWQTPAAAKLGENFYFIINQAHNGFLEVYIQTGFISLLLLIGALIASGNKLKKGLLLGSTHSMLLFTFSIIILLNNLTEASINKLSILWFVLIIALLYCPKASSAKLRK